MKIGIEGQRLFRKNKHGMDFVALELIKQLPAMDTTNEYVLFVRPDEDRSCLPPSSNLRIIEVPALSYPDWEQYGLPMAARKAGVDILHCTSNTAPLFPGVPTIITLHDIIYLERNQMRHQQGSWYQRLGNLYRRIVVPHTISKCQLVITVSHYEKKRIVEALNLPNDRVQVVHNGVGQHFTRISDRDELEDLRIKYRLPDRFIFFLGNSDPKKNVTGVLKAFAQLPEKNPLQLVMADYSRFRLMNDLERIGHPELARRIHLVDYVENHDLPGIYNASEMFLYPSLRESFGIPILEAMACGTPVITSNTSSMPEVAGEAALLVDPGRPAQITDAIQRILHGPDTRYHLIDQGIRRAQTFSWKMAASKVADLYGSLN